MRCLTNKEIRMLTNYFLENYNIDIKELIKDKTIIFDEKEKLYFLENIPIAFIYNEKIYPTLFLISKIEPDIPYVIVDLGAKEKILNGADVFKPGIIEMDKRMKKDFPVLIISSDRALLALGIALYNYEELLKMEKGKVIKNIHYYGDKIFRLKR